MRLTTLFRKLLNIANTVVREVRLEGGTLVMEVRPSWRRPRCGGCQRSTSKVHGTAVKRREWRHLGLWGCQVVLRAEMVRVQCRRCGVRTMAVPWARPGSIFTRPFEDELAWFLQRSNQTAVASYFGVGWLAAGRIARRVVADRRDARALDNLRLIGVDEICWGRPRKFMTVVTNHETGQMVWAAEGQSAAVLEGLWDQLGAERCAQILLVSMDMSAAYEKAVRDRLPQAEIVFDRFHVVQLLGKAVDEVRREQARRACGDQAAALKSSRFALLKNPWNLVDSEEAKLAEIARTNQTLYRTYLLKESFQNIFESETPRQASRRFNRWYQSAVRSRITPMVRFARTIHQKWPAVRRFFEYRLTNALSEGCNNKIRMLSHRAFGFHSAEALIAMAFLCTSNIRIQPLGY